LLSASCAKTAVIELPGSSARIGYSDGGMNTYEFSGSGVSNSFLDSSHSSTSLIQNSLNTDVLGRYIIPVRGGIRNPELTPEQMVGGVMVPIDSVSLLLVGALSTTWLIPVVLIAVGFGLFFVKRK